MITATATATATAVSEPISATVTGPIRLLDLLPTVTLDDAKMSKDASARLADLRSVQRVRELVGWKARERLDDDDSLATLRATVVTEVVDHIINGHQAPPAAAAIVVITDKYKNKLSDGTWLAARPVVSATEIIRVAGKLGLAVFPGHCLSDAARALADEKTRKEIDIMLGCAKHLDVYAVAPFAYFSLDAHIQAKQQANSPILPPPGWEQAIAAIEMMLPFLRRLDQDAKETKIQMKEIQARLERLSAQIETAISGGPNKAKAIAYDPLLFAVARDADVAFAPARIGPCWGPPLDRKMLKALGL